MKAIKWKSADDIKRHGADWCVGPCADKVSLPVLEGLVERINQIIASAIEIGRSEQK